MKIVEIVGSSPNLVVPSTNEFHEHLDVLDEQIFDINAGNYRELSLFYLPLIGMVVELTDKIQLRLDEYLGRIQTHDPFRPSLIELREWYRKVNDSFKLMDLRVTGRFGNLMELTELHNQSRKAGVLPYAMRENKLALKMRYNSWRKRHFEGFWVEPAQWHPLIFANFAVWLDLVLDPQFHDGQPTSHIYLKTDKPVPKLPRLYRYGNWVSGFGGRLIVPNLAGLNADDKAAMWDDLLVRQKIYDNHNIDHSVRQAVFELIIQQIPQQAVEHIDLCGGKGDFFTFLSPKRSDLHSVLLDISPQAVAEAQAHGIVAEVADAEAELPRAPESVDVVTINFAVQWLKPQAFEQVWRVLKPGGVLLFNVYPPVPEEAERYQKMIEAFGYQVSTTTVPFRNGFNFILRAQKPTPNPS